MLEYQLGKQKDQRYCTCKNIYIYPGVKNLEFIEDFSIDDPKDKKSYHAYNRADHLFYLIIIEGSETGDENT